MMFRHVMINLGEQFTDNEVDEILSEIDTTGNGIIRYEGNMMKSNEFINVIIRIFIEVVKMVLGKHQSS